MNSPKTTLLYSNKERNIVCSKESKTNNTKTTRRKKEQKRFKKKEKKITFFSYTLLRIFFMPSFFLRSYRLLRLLEQHEHFCQSCLAEEHVCATDAIRLLILLLVSKTSKMLLAVLTAEVLGMVSLVTHHDTLAGSDGHAASSAKETLLGIVVLLAVWETVVARDEAQSSKRLVAKRALEARLMPNLAHSLNFRLILDGSVAGAANCRENLIEISFTVGEAIRTFTAVGAIAEVLVANLANKVIRMPGHLEGSQNLTFDGLLASRANRQTHLSYLYTFKRKQERTNEQDN